MRKPYPVRLFLIIALLISTTSFVSSQAGIPNTLRQGITVDETTIKTALELQSKGWIYIMPQPKSAQARWGNTDGRTTWYVGYWLNEKTRETSSSVPVKKEGVYVGDGLGGSYWRRGGSPSSPSKLEWLLSKSGGIKPFN